MFSDSGGGGSADSFGSAKTAADELAERIASGAVSTKIDSKKQEKHIEGSAQYKKAIKEGKHPSRLTLDKKEQQTVVDKYIKEGEAEKRADGSIRVCFNYDKPIGVSCGKDGKTESETTTGEIHISKSGTHIVPVKQRSDL